MAFWGQTKIRQNNSAGWAGLAVLKKPPCIFLQLPQVDMKNVVKYGKDFVAHTSPLHKPIKIPCFGIQNIPKYDKNNFRLGFSKNVHVKSISSHGGGIVVCLLAGFSVWVCWREAKAAPQPAKKHYTAMQSLGWFKTLGKCHKLLLIKLVSKLV